MMNRTDFSGLFPALNYGGKRIRLAEWPHQVVDSRETEYSLITVHEFHSPDGLLKVKVTKEEFRDFPALRCRNELMGCGTADTPICT